VDDAAVHHVFDGGWIWVLRFNNGVTSAGAAVDARLAKELNFAEGAAAWERLLNRLPTVREQFRDAKAALPFVYAKATVVSERLHHRQQLGAAAVCRGFHRSSALDWFSSDVAGRRTARVDAREALGP
jgi:FADH2 O2-dependent halogenase